MKIVELFLDFVWVLNFHPTYLKQANGEKFPGLEKLNQVHHIKCTHKLKKIMKITLNELLVTLGAITVFGICLYIGLSTNFENFA